MSVVEYSKEALSSASSDSIKVSSDGESLGQSILKLEMNLSKEIKENLAMGNNKMLAEFIKVQKNFEDMFDRMDHQEETTEKIRLQFDQLNARFEKFERDQENLNKRINGLMASGALKTNSYVTPVNQNSMSNARSRASFNPNTARPQQQAQQHRNRTFVSKFVKADLPEEKPQFSSNDQKCWTLRGEGMFTESNSSSEDEHVSKVVSESMISAKLSDCVTTAMGSVSKSTMDSMDVPSDSKSQESEREEILKEKVFDNLTLTDALKRMIEPAVKICAVVESPKVVEAPKVVDTPKVVEAPKVVETQVILEEKVCLAVNRADEPAIIVKEEIVLLQGDKNLLPAAITESKVVVSPKKEKPSPPTVGSPCAISVDVAEALAKMTAAVSKPLCSSPAAKPASGGLTGGFGSFRRGKPTNVTPVVQKTIVEDVKGKLATPVRATEGLIGEIVSRPLTIDEMSVLNKVFQKKESPKPGAFFGKRGGGGAMIPAAAVQRRSPAAQFSSSPSFSLPRNPKGVGASFGNNWRKQQPTRKFGL